MPGRRGHRLGAPDGAEYRHPDAVQRVQQQLLVPVRADPVEYDPGQLSLRVVAAEAGHQRGHRAPGRRGIDDEHDRRVQQPGQVGGGGEVRVVATRPVRRHAVEQAHHALDDRDIGARRAVQEQRDHQLLAAQHGIEVAARPAGGQGVIAGIDVVRACLVPGHPQSSLGHRCHQAGGHGRLTAPGGRGRDDEPWHGYHSIPF